MAKTVLFQMIMIIISILNKSTCSCHNDNDNNNDYDMIMGMFVFGSSLVDNGNNNFMGNSLAKANYLPYGIDFPEGPSGRFTNGKNVVDLIAIKLGIPYFTPPFADPTTTGARLSRGVNFASGASGILDTTGSIAGNVTSLNAQIRNFEEKTVPELEAQLGCKRKQLLRKYVFVIGSGSNDYSFNYFLNNNGFNRNLSLQSFTAKLTASLSYKIKKLYRLGGRKFVVMGINPLGCSPMVTTVRRQTQNNQNKNQKYQCIEELNFAARLFNNYLNKSLIEFLKPQMPGSDLVFVNSYKIIMDIITNPSSKGFEEAGKPCCKVGLVSKGGNGVLCERKGRVCNDRNAHIFFDGLHPTEAVNVQIANKAYASNLNTEVYPTNIRQIMAKPCPQG